MRFWKNIVSAIVLGTMLAACTAEDGARLHIRGADIAQGVLTARLQWQPSAAVLDALDHGIVLAFVVDVRAYAPRRFGWSGMLAHAQRHIELRYFPLSRRYQLRDLDGGETRSYAARALLLAALEDLRLALPDGWPGTAAGYALSVVLDPERLPGALRLPALLRAEWHVSSGDYAWPAAG